MRLCRLTQNADQPGAGAIELGYRLQQASDDPSAISEIYGLQTQIAFNQQTQTNLGGAQTELSAADTALQSSIQAVESAISLASQGASSTSTAQDRPTLPLKLRGSSRLCTGNEGDVIAGLVAVNPAGPDAGFLRRRVSIIVEPPYARDLARLAAQVVNTREVLSRIEENAPRVAAFLASHPAVRTTHWAHEAASRANYLAISRSPGATGGMISFTLRGSWSPSTTGCAFPRGRASACARRSSAPSCTWPTTAW